MRFAVLGPVLIADARGEWQRLRSDRLRALLAMLLFEANQPVSVERLVDALWLGAPPKSYVSNLHTYVSRLRDRVGATRIEHSSRGYRLLVDEHDVDLLVFLAESERGRQAARAGELPEAVKHLRTALAQWRDRPLADLQLSALEPEVVRLEAEYLAVFEECMAAELAAGRHAEVVAELRAATTRFPLSERLAGQLIVALQWSGRQAEALDVYRDTRARLIEEAGIEPGPELRQVYAQALHGELSAPGARPICQLPRDIPDFSGRQAIVAELTATARREPLVVLSGEPGVGKSTLAVRVAHRLREDFPDGQLFAHLAGATNPRDPADILAEWLAVLRGPDPDIPRDLEARAAMFRAHLADRRMLVVLDDAGSPAQVRPLLPGTAGCTVLVTSRRRLSGLAGAHVFAVDPFTDAEAGALLERIAGARVAAEPASAARILAACGNLPLALRIAGTRLALRPQLNLAAFADRLEDEVRRLDELTVNDLQVRSSLALSYRSLTPAAQTTFQLFGIVDIPNLSTLAISVLRGESESDDAVEELVEASLLQPVGEDSSGEPRYQTHDLVRAFARELALAKDGLAEREMASNRLVDTAFALADLAAHRLPRAMPVPIFSGAAPEPGVAASTVRRVLADPEAWFAAERQSITAGLGVLCRVGWHRKAMLVFERFGPYLWLHGHYADLRSCAENLAAAARVAGDEDIQARADAVLALLLHIRGHYAQAAARYRLAIESLDRQGNQPALAWALVNLASCLISLGTPDESLALIAHAEPMFQADDFGVLTVLRARSAALHRLGRSAEAVGVDTAALALARRGEQPLLIASALRSLSWSRVLTGAVDRAAALAEEAVARIRPTTARSALALSLRALGTVRAGLGDRDGALEAFRETLGIAEELGEQPRILSCTRAIAASWIGDGRAGDAIAELRRCLEAYRGLGGVPAVTVTLRLLAAAYEASGDASAAAAAHAEADRLADPRDASTRALSQLLLGLTRVP